MRLPTANVTPTAPATKGDGSSNGSTPSSSRVCARSAVSGSEDTAAAIRAAVASISRPSGCRSTDYRATRSYNRWGQCHHTGPAADGAAPLDGQDCDGGGGRAGRAACGLDGDADPVAGPDGGCQQGAAVHQAGRTGTGRAHHPHLVDAAGRQGR